MISNTTPDTFSFEPSGPFDLANQNRYFGGWPTLNREEGAIVMAFPVEATETAAAVVLRQGQHGVVEGAVHGCPLGLVDVARRQALAAISLDVDASGWSAVGEHDPVIGRLQAKYRHVRPTLFHSPYEAAAAFVIGHRISIRQARALRARIAAEIGATIAIDGHQFAAFPTPTQLLEADRVPGISSTKTERLRAIARAAQDGWLAREPLRAMPRDAALTKLRTLPGVGAFFSQGILYRGAGTVDALSDDEITRFAVAQAFERKKAVDHHTLREIAETWRPYRTWTVVLLHLWARSELQLPRGRGSRPPSTPRPVAQQCA
jgi:3-methyladenine DNA glycosylase/8-oxoguanine DNA glycosylase